MTTETRTHADAERTAGEDAGIDGDDALRTFVLFVAGTLAFSWGLWALPLLGIVPSSLMGILARVGGFVHLWYVVLSQGWVEMEDAMGWNGRSWLLSDLLAEGTVLSLASVLYVLVAVGFLVGGVGYALGRDWTTPVLVGTAVLSTVVLVAMWDGRFDLLIEKGVGGVAINVVVVVLLVLR